MSLPGAPAQLSLDQAPPLAIPASFFAAAPFALIGAGQLLLFERSALLQSHWAPGTLVLTHLCTLGFLGLVMCGALYQMVPVVAGRRVPAIRLAWLVFAGLAGGVLLLPLGVYGLRPGLFSAFSVIAIAVLLHTVPVLVALLRSRARTVTVHGMRLAVFVFFVTMLLGSWMSHGFGGMPFPGNRELWIQVHLSVALIGWVGGLISAVSWQVIPMFYLTPEPTRSQQRLVFGGVLLGSLLPLLVLAAEAFGLVTTPMARGLAGASALPGALALGVLHPLFGLGALRARRRRRVDVSFVFWQYGLALAPLVLLAAVLAFFIGGRCTLLFVWLAIFGWAGIVVHGMLARILPFLFWFHRWSLLVGHVTVPSMRQMLPEAHVRRGLWLHLATLLLGSAAILWPVPWLAFATGAGLLGTGAVLFGYSLVLWPQRPRRRHAGS